MCAFTSILVASLFAGTAEVQVRVERPPMVVGVVLVDGVQVRDTNSVRLLPGQHVLEIRTVDGTEVRVQKQTFAIVAGKSYTIAVKLGRVYPLEIVI